MRFLTFFILKSLKLIYGFLFYYSIYHLYKIVINDIEVNKITENIYIQCT